jgi:nucleotide-binding universal stress UspA family protein
VAGGLFERIVCGVDSSPESLEAVRQADVLLEPGGRLVLVAAVDVTAAVHFRLAPTAIHAARHALEDIEERDREALAALERARAEATHAAEVATLESAGRPADCLFEAVASERATLAVVGSHGLGRAAGVLLGSVATRVLHQAPCSVFVARGRGTGSWSPRTIVVGVDGSPAADAALRAGRELEERFGSDLTPLTVAGRRPAHELVEAAAEADLIAVGSRAERRALGLGSVAERVAHHAGCSVLVVRERARAADD